MPKVKVNHSGACGEYHYKAGEVVTLPQDVIDAIGEDSIEYVSKKADVKEEKKAVTKPPVDKMIKADDAEKKDAEAGDDAEQTTDDKGEVKE